MSDSIVVSSLIGQAESIKESCEEEKIRLQQTKSHSDYVSRSHALGGTVSIHNSYNDLRKSFNKFIEKNVDEDFLESAKLSQLSFSPASGGNVPRNEVTSFLNSIQTECDKAVRSLTEWQDLSIPMEKEKKLEEVKEDLAQLPEDLYQFTKILNKSIDAYRDGHYLGSSLISGKIIDIVLDKVDREAKKEYDIDEKKERQNTYLEDKEILYPNEGDITSAIKVYRDIYSHQIDKNPDWDDSLLMIVGSKKLLQGITEAEMQHRLDLV